MDCFTGFWPLDWKRTLKVNDYVSMTFDCFMSHISGEASPYSETKFMELPTSFLANSKLTGLEIYFELTVF